MVNKSNAKCWSLTWKGKELEEHGLGCQKDSKSKCSCQEIINNQDHGQEITVDLHGQEITNSQDHGQEITNNQDHGQETTNNQCCRKVTINHGKDRHGKDQHGKGRLGKNQQDKDQRGED